MDRLFGRSAWGVLMMVAACGTSSVRLPRGAERRPGGVQQTVKAGPPQLAVPVFQPGVQHLRLLPLGRVQRDTTAWWVTRELQSKGSRVVGLQVMVSTRGGRTTTDSLLFDPQTLAPYWEHTNGADVRHVVFTDSEVITKISDGDGDTRIVRPRTPGHAYSSAMDDLVLQSLPLAEGYHAVLPFWNGDGVEIDTIRVRRAHDAAAKPASHAVWIVEMAEPNTIETLRIDSISRSITRHLYRARRTGAVSEVRAKS